MFRIHKFLSFLVIFLLAALASACAPLLTPVRTSGQAPTPVVRFESGAVEDPDVYVDLEPFQAALLQAIQSRDQSKLERLTAENFVSGWWHGEIMDTFRADALLELYRDQLGEEIKLGTPQNINLTELMGGTNPLDLPRPEANVIQTIFVTGWGKDGSDEAILFVSRRSDNSLRWAGTLVIQGGFTSPETGGVEPFINPRHGYQTYVPRGFEVTQPMPNEFAILAPKGTEGHRARAMISVEPANGRSVEQIVEELKSSVLADVASQPSTALGLDTEMALVFDRVPSQDLMRMLLTVHEDRLYKMIFIPQDENQGEAYQQMQNVYAVLVNTFKFIPIESVGTAQPAGGKLVAEPAVFIQLLQQGLAERNSSALQSMMGELVNFSIWRNTEESEWLSPGDASQKILTDFVSSGAQPVLELNHLVISQWFSDSLTTPDGEELIPVFVSNWGAEGRDEAVFFIARRANGSLYWHRVLTAEGGFPR